MTWHKCLELGAHLATVGAIVLGVFTLKEQKRLEHETATQTMIHDQYELCRGLDEMRVATPEMSHMLALPAQAEGAETWANYALFKSKVKQHMEAQGKCTESTRSKFYLQEHAVALHICDIYEQTLFQHQLATEARDGQRALILLSLCEYYEKRVLRNPRLRYHWDHGASDMMEESTRKTYDAKVRNAFPKDSVDNQSPID
jgi:hypothetical protein